MKNRWLITMASVSLLTIVAGCQKTTPVSSTLDMRNDTVDKRSIPPSQEVSEQPSDLLPPSKSQIGEEGLDSMKNASKKSGQESMQDVYFDFDQWTVRADMSSTLEQNAFWLHEHPNATVKLEGFCDEKGTEEYNLALGERRARSASAFLANLGVAPSRISVVSYGEETLVCAEESDACHQKNRRVHFTSN